MLNRLKLLGVIFLLFITIWPEFSCSGSTLKQKRDVECLRYASDAELYCKTKDYARLFQIPDDALTCDSSTKIRVITFKAIGYLETKQFQKAIHLFTELIAIHPWDAPLYEQRGLAYDNSRKFDEAMHDYNKALSLDSTLTLARNNRGQIYSSMGNKEAAKADFDFVIAHDTSIFSAYNNRGLLYQEKGEDKLAIKDFEKGLTIRPYDLLFYNLSTSQARIGEFDKALISIDNAISLYPNSPSYYNNRGYIKLELNDREGACDDFQIAKSLGADMTEEINKYCR